MKYFVNFIENSIFYESPICQDRLESKEFKTFLEARTFSKSCDLFDILRCDENEEFVTVETNFQIDEDNLIKEI